MTNMHSSQNKLRTTEVTRTLKYDSPALYLGIYVHVEKNVCGPDRLI